MSVQYIEEDLRLIYSILHGRDYKSNFPKVELAPMGKLLKSLHELDEELGYSKIKEPDYQLLDEVSEIKNYWCHQ
jgi:hypothetical protein